MSQYDNGETKMATKEFTLDEAVEVFNLKYSAIKSEGKWHFWNINDLLETKNFAPTLCIGKVSASSY
jgi:hypothetical protein